MEITTQRSTMASPGSGTRRRALPAGAERTSSLAAVAFLCTAVLACSPAAAHNSSLTAGFTQVGLPEGDFVVQSPYNVPVDERYIYASGIRVFTVYADDKPFNTVTPTNPRTEVRLTGHDYSSGVWQFEGYLFVLEGTSGASVVQIHNENGGVPATTMMLHVYNGTLRYYSGSAVQDSVYGRWLRINVVHDVGEKTVAVYVDGERRLTADVKPSRSHYFKFGVYMQHHDVSEKMEVGWKNVTLYEKSEVVPAAPPSGGVSLAHRSQTCIFLYLLFLSFVFLSQMH